jgi:hypothetical protein
MYKDIINYELESGVSIEQLLAVAKQVADEWMQNQPGFIKWDIHTHKDGSFTDIVYWENEESAKLAEKDMGNIPNAAVWYGCYKEGSITSKNLSLVASF